MDLSNENVLHIKVKEIQYLQFKKLLNYTEIKYAYVIGLDKDFNINKNDDAENYYKKICDELSLDYNNIVNTKQNHTDNIQIINEKLNKDKPDFYMYEDTDGLITNKKGIVLATINADCILLVFYDPMKKVIANVHSGWRGTLKRISEKTVKKMVEEYGCNPENIICCMSPSIRKDHFEVDVDVYKLFFEEFKNLHHLENIFELKNNKWYIDTILINKEILKNQGLKEENIIDSGICSVCNKDIIHSYRAHGENSGRATQIISIS